MSFEATKWAWTLELPIVQKFTLMALADHADADGLCWPSVARLCEMIGARERAVRSAISDLEKAGYIVCDRHPRRTTRYRLSVPVVAASENLQLREEVQESERGAPRAPQSVATIVHQEQEVVHVVHPRGAPHAPEPIKEPIKLKLASLAAKKPTKPKQRPCDLHGEALYAAWREQAYDPTAGLSLQDFIISLRKKPPKSMGRPKGAKPQPSTPVGAATPCCFVQQKAA